MNIQDTRPNEFQKVSKWFDTAHQSSDLEIYGISGHGGIGKSYLLAHVLEQSRPFTDKALSISVDASDSSILGNFMAIYDRKISPKTLSVGKSNYDYFPHARKLVGDHSSLEKDVTTKIEDSESSNEVKEAANWIFRTGSLLNDTLPVTKDYVDFEALKARGLDHKLEEAVELLESVGDLRLSSRLPGPLKDMLGVTKRERLRTDLYALAADEWLVDVSAALGPYRRKDKLRFTHSSIDEAEHLLLIIDDFEILGTTIIDFLTTALIPELSKSNFASTIIILGRDDLSDAHVEFQHHLAPFVKDKIRLEKFSKKVTTKMFREAKHPTKDIPALLEESLGLPFLVQLLCEAKGGTVSFYQQFYERTTRWMAPTEKDWVLPLCYLDQVTEESVSTMLPDYSPETVMEWFKHEASIRDPTGKVFAVAPYIRRTLLEYNRLTLGTRKHNKLVTKGREATRDE